MAVCATAPPCGWSGNDYRLNEVQIPHLLSLSAGLCLYWRNNVVVGWSCMMFIFLNLNYCVYVYKIILEHLTSRGALNPTKTAERADSSSHWQMTSHFSCLFLFFTLHCGKRESPGLSFSGVHPEPSTDCSWVGKKMFFYVHITHYFSPSISVLPFLFLWILDWIFKYVWNVLLDWKMSILYWH